jgi:beta-lactamase regulating signal transducer with metallopeptidase domain
MTEAALPLLGTAIIFGIVLPLSALSARAILWTLACFQTSGLHRFGALRYALLVGSTAIPLAWFISACLHQAETGTAAGVCMVPDPPGVLCPEVAALAGMLVLLVAVTALPRVVLERRALRGSRSAEALAARERIEQLARRHADLLPILAGLVITERADEPIATLGVLRPRVVIDASFAARLDEDALLAALKHEAEHARNWDPLRYFLAWWAVSINPVGTWLLGPELRRWILGQEIHCDREAVLNGASAPALAQALVQAARFPAGSGCPALRAADAQILRLRVGLLMAYADRHPQRWGRVPALRFALAGLLVALVIPHQFDDGALDALHRASESAAGLILGA